MTDLGHGKDIKFVKTIDPSTPMEYSGTATISTDNQIATIKFVNDHPGAAAALHENLTISAPGQTAFTLSSTPVNPDRSILTLNGQVRKYGGGDDYSISGTSLTWNDPGGLTLLTTDDLQIWYNVTVGGGFLAQEQIYYVAKAGNDGNDGKSEESPFLTIGAAVTAVNAQTPGTGNRFEIQIVGSDTYTENFTLPTYTTLNGPSVRINGTVTLVAESNLICDELSAPNSANGINMTTAVEAYAEITLLNGGTSSTGINLNQGALRANIKHINMIGVGSKAYAINVGAPLILDYLTLRENTASTKAGAAVVFERGLDSRSNADTVIYNETGDIIIDSDGNNIILKDSAVGEIFTSIGVFPKWTNTPLVEARLSGTQADATGGGVAATVIFDNDIVNIGADYNNTTGIFTVPVTGYYYVASGLVLADLAAVNTGLIAIINATGITRNLAIGNPGAMRHGTTNQYAFGAGTILKMTGASTLIIQVTVAGGTQIIDILPDSYLSIYLLGAA